MSLLSIFKIIINSFLGAFFVNIYRKNRGSRVAPAVGPGERKEAGL